MTLYPFYRLVYKLIRKSIRFIQRIRLKNKDFSIICQNCIGGVIYNRLGLPFLSPTINLWMEEKDFYRFASNLKHYLSQELRFVKGIDPTPTAWCDDIMIHFNHYQTEQEAAEKWYERCKRVNYDNLFFVCSDRWSVSKDLQPSEEDIRSLANVDARGRCVFAVKDYEGLDYIYHSRKDPDDDCVFPFMLDYVSKKMVEKYHLPLWKWEFKFDYVKWLNGSRKQ